MPPRARAEWTTAIISSSPPPPPPPQQQERNSRRISWSNSWLYRRNIFRSYVFKWHCMFTTSSLFWWHFYDLSRIEHLFRIRISLRIQTRSSKIKTQKQFLYFWGFTILFYPESFMNLTLYMQLANAIKPCSLTRRGFHKLFLRGPSPCCRPKD